jgi:hypothetical protein
MYYTRQIIFLWELFLTLIDQSAIFKDNNFKTSRKVVHIFTYFCLADKVEDLMSSLTMSFYKAV